PALPGRHHPARAGRDRSDVLQDGAAQSLGGPQRRRARLSLGHAVDRGALRADPADPAELRRPHDASRGSRGSRAAPPHRAERDARRRAPPRRPEAQPPRRVDRSPRAAAVPRVYKGGAMHVIMVKKKLADGSDCRKCNEVTQYLQSRGLWDRIDEVVWARENDPQSPGQVLGARFGIERAPFFIVRDDAGETAYRSVLQLIQ